MLRDSLDYGMLALRVSVRYLRGYAVLRGGGFWIICSGERFSPLSARICSATAGKQRANVRSLLFQSAICADMQCYDTKTRQAALEATFQSAICADMQCYAKSEDVLARFNAFQSAICADMQCY